MSEYRLNNTEQRYGLSLRKAPNLQSIERKELLFEKAVKGKCYEESDK